MNKEPNQDNETPNGIMAGRDKDTVEQAPESLPLNGLVIPAGDHNRDFFYRTR